MTICPKCDLEKPDESFIPRASRVNLPLDRWCVDCRTKFADRRSARSLRLSERAARLVTNYSMPADPFEGRECIDCGRRNKDLLMFDTLDGDVFINSPRQIERNIAKLTVRCANCLVDRYRNIYKIPVFYIPTRP